MEVTLGRHLLFVVSSFVCMGEFGYDLNADGNVNNVNAVQTGDINGMRMGNVRI